MKTRLGYVSNSSSSSYIVALDEKGFIEFKDTGISFTISDFLSMLNSSNDDDTRLEAYGEEDVISNENRSTWCGEPDIERNESIRKFISDHAGMEVATVSISYHDHFAKKIYDAFKSTGVIIEHEEFEN